MSNTVHIQITRPSITGKCGFLVAVHRRFSDIGFYTNGEGDETPYALTLSEQEEALAIFQSEGSEYYTEQGVYDPVTPHGSREQDDRAARDWESMRIGR